jgi:hypothetical protein
MNEAGQPPAPKPPSLPEEAGRKKRGCGTRFLLLGCSGLLVVLALLAWGSWHAYTNIVLPWFDGKKQEISEKVPLTEKVFEAAEAIGMDGIDINAIADMEVPDTLSIVALEEGSVDPDDFPDDVYIPNGYARSAFRTSAREALAVLEFSVGSTRKMTALYADQMKKLGWKMEKFPKPEESVALNFTKGQQTALVSITMSDDGVEVWIRISRI